VGTGVTVGAVAGDEATGRDLEARRAIDEGGDRRRAGGHRVVGDELQTNDAGRGLNLGGAQRGVAAAHHRPTRVGDPARRVEAADEVDPLGDLERSFVVAYSGVDRPGWLEEHRELNRAVDLPDGIVPRPRSVVVAARRRVDRLRLDSIDAVAVLVDAVGQVRLGQLRHARVLAAVVG